MGRHAKGLKDCLTKLFEDSCSRAGLAHKNTEALQGVDRIVVLVGWRKGRTKISPTFEGDGGDRLTEVVKSFALPRTQKPVIEQGWQSRMAGSGEEEVTEQLVCCC